MGKVNLLVASVLLLGVGQSFADNIPSGSYIQTCSSIHVSTDIVPYTLTAECLDLDGSYRAAKLESIDNCYGDIENENGQLKCQLKALPNNFYLTCRSVVFQQNSLSAVCLDIKRHEQVTTLDNFLSCPSHIKNINGQLTCM